MVTDRDRHSLPLPRILGPFPAAVRAVQFPPEILITPEETRLNRDCWPLKPLPLAEPLAAVQEMP